MMQFCSLLCGVGLIFLAFGFLAFVAWIMEQNHDYNTCQKP